MVTEDDHVTPPSLETWKFAFGAVMVITPGAPVKSAPEILNV